MGIFDNAETVIINNKEVESIITSDGGVIYQKSSGEDSLLLTADKSIVQTGETATLTATALNQYNQPRSGVTLTVYQDGISKGTITTGIDGTANYLYSSAGIGDTTFCVSDGTIQSGTYTITDCLFYDSGVTGTKNTDFYKSGNGTVNTTATGTTITASSNTAYRTTTSFTGDFEAIVTATVGSNAVRIGLSKVGATTTQTKFVSVLPNQEVYYKITRRNGVITVQYSTDMINWTNRTLETNNIGTDDCYFTFLVETSGTERTITYKDLKIYSIPPEVSEITLTADKSIIQSGETATLTATLTGSDVGGKTVSFVIKHNNVTVDTLTGTTDNNGVCSVSYVGEGTGDLNIQADYNGMIQSEIYAVLDCIKYDKGNSTNPFWTLGNNGNAQLDLVDNIYRKLSEITTGTDAWVYLKIDHSCVLEFDVQVVSTNYSRVFGQYGQSGNANTRYNFPLPQSLRDGNWHNFKFELKTEELGIENNSKIFVFDVENSNDISQNIKEKKDIQKYSLNIIYYDENLLNKENSDN